MRSVNTTVRSGGSSSFDIAITPRPRAGGDYEIAFDSSWWVDFGPNGGFLSAVLTRAVELEATRLEISHSPASASIHYLRAPKLGLALIRVQLIRTGRTTTVFSIDLHQEDIGSLVTALFTLVKSSADEPAVRVHHPGTLAPPPAPGSSRPLFEGASPAYLDHWEFQPVRGHVPFSSPMSTPDGPLELRRLDTPA